MGLIDEVNKNSWRDCGLLNDQNTLQVIIGTKVIIRRDMDNYMGIY